MIMILINFLKIIIKIKIKINLKFFKLNLFVFFGKFLALVLLYAEHSHNT